MRRSKSRVLEYTVLVSNSGIGALSMIDIRDSDKNVYAHTHYATLLPAFSCFPVGVLGCIPRPQLQRYKRTRLTIIVLNSILESPKAL